jgi:hypothetical protein
MRFRKLRIAWSVFWGLACVLLVVLWVRSYWYWDGACDHIDGTHGLELHSLRGKTCVRYVTQIRPPDPERGWYCGSDLISEYEAKSKEQARLPGSLIWEFEGAMPYLSLPHSLYALVFATIAAVPWIHWSRRFRLRALLIATTLVAVLLGSIVWSMR